MTVWDVPAYGCPDIERAGPPVIGVDGTDLTDPPAGFRLVNAMLRTDAMVADGGSPFQEIRRRLEGCPIINRVGHPHWRDDHAPFFTAHGVRRAVRGANEIRPLIDSAAHSL